MPLAVDLEVVGADEVDDALDHRRRGIASRRRRADRGGIKS
jgi:hypothetical protein